MQSDLNSSSHLQNYFSVPKQLNWDEYFMLQAMMASFKSKDPSTKVGAVFVDSHHHQITMGYNGFVAGVDESRLPWGNHPEAPLEHQKYGYVVHAEANAILHSPVPLAGSTLYVTLFPCHECCKLIAGQKVKEVIFLSDKYKKTESNRIARKILDLSHINYRKLELSSSLLERLSQHFQNLLEDM